MTKFWKEYLKFRRDVGKGNGENYITRISTICALRLPLSDRAQLLERDTSGSSLCSLLAPVPRGPVNTTAILDERLTPATTHSTALRTAPAQAQRSDGRFPEAERTETASVVIQYSFGCKIYKNSSNMWADIFFLAAISQVGCGLTAHVTTFVTFDWLPTNIKQNLEITKLQLK